MQDKSSDEVPSTGVLRQLRRIYWALVALFVSACLAAGGSIYYTNQVQQQWCDLLTTLDTAYQTTPPPSATGKEVARQIHNLTDRLNCR